MYKPSAQPVVVMYSSHHPVTTSMNGLGTNSFDDTSTINPNALNSSVSIPATGHPYDLGPRGRKRSHSPDSYPDGIPGGQLDEDNPLQKKRGRPRKDTKTSLDSPIPQSPHSRPSGSSHGVPAIGKPAPAKPPTKQVIKALPTVRDHTTDTPNPEGDEFLPREFDTEGDKKVSLDGLPLGGREYRVRTFLVPNRGNKLFMLATECARVLSYRDSYLLFNKNRSLFKIIANQTEKDDLISQEILPYSYRSRQIAIVTARSMFRQFGSRLIVDGRRVRDDYWEAKARKQGFTEDDPAGEKRPGGQARLREAEAANPPIPPHPPHVVYNHQPGMPLDPNDPSQYVHNLSQLPTIRPTNELSMRSDYSSIPRGQRLDITGNPYQDRPITSSSSDMLNQTTHAAGFNTVVLSTAAARRENTDQYYKQPRDITNPGVLQPGPGSPSVSNAQIPSVQTPAANLQSIMGQQAPPLSHSHVYSHQPSHPHQSPPLPSASQTHQSSGSPARTMQPHQTGIGYPPGSVPQAPYGYSQQHPPQMWGQPPQASHQSPVSQQHSLPQYTSQGSHGPPHQAASPHQHSQSSQHLQHSPSTGPMHNAMGYGQMPAYASQTPMYRPQQTSSPHGYMQQQQQQPAAGTNTGSHQWAPPSQQSHNQSWSGGY